MPPEMERPAKWNGRPSASADATAVRSVSRLSPAGPGVTSWLGNPDKFHQFRLATLQATDTRSSQSSIGDHGGAQELAQRIPMIIHVPGDAPTTRTTPLRLMDLAPETTTILGLKLAPMMSGENGY